MTLEKVLDEIKIILLKWKERKKTGSVSVEIHYREGGIAEAYIIPKRKVID